MRQRTSCPARDILNNNIRRLSELRQPEECPPTIHRQNRVEDIDSPWLFQKSERCYHVVNSFLKTQRRIVKMSIEGIEHSAFQKIVGYINIAHGRTFSGKQNVATNAISGNRFDSKVRPGRTILRIFFVLP